MTTVKEEIVALEDALRLAELGPDASFFERVLDDEALIDGQRLKSKIVEAHQPTGGSKFLKVEMSNYVIVDHGNCAVVTCQGDFTNTQKTFTLKFMRVWTKKNNTWKIIAASTHP